MFCKILLPIDGSANSERALTEAIDLCRSTKARLTIMTSAPEPSAWILGGAGRVPVDLAALSQDTERVFARFLNAAVDRVPHDVSVTKILTRGRAATRILEEIERGGHDLVMMGSRGRGEMRSLLLGSVSHEVLNTSHVAVMVIPGDE